MSVVWDSLDQISKRPSDITQQCWPTRCHVSSQRPPLTSPARPSEFQNMASFWMLGLVVPHCLCLKLGDLPLRSTPSSLHLECHNRSYVLAAQSQHITAALGMGGGRVGETENQEGRLPCSQKPATPGHSGHLYRSQTPVQYIL